MKPKKTILLISLFAISNEVCLGQKKYTVSTEQRSVHINDGNKRIDATINTDKKPSINPGLRYFWYDNSNIHETQGGYSGYILHGQYTEYYDPENNLAVKGKFKNGLKQGYWNTWYINGNLKDRTKWKHGQLWGKRYLYSQKGNITRIERYRENMLNGRATETDTNDIETRIYYKDGIVVKHVSPIQTFANRFKKNPAGNSEAKAKQKETKTKKDPPKPSTKITGRSKEKKSFFDPVKKIFKKKPKNSSGNTKRK